MFHGVLLPLPRLVCCLIAGICMGIWLNMQFPHLIIFFLIVMALACSFLPSVYACNYSGRWRFGMLSAFIFLMLGYYLARTADLSTHPMHFSTHEQGEGMLLLFLTKNATEKSNAYQLSCRVDALIRGEEGLRTKGKLMLYLEKDSLAAALRYGDMILIDKRYEESAPPKNPQQFDYSRYLARNNIFHTTYRKRGEWQNTGMNRGIFLLRWAERLHQRALQFFRHQALSERDYAVLSALLLGYRDMLDDELRNAFAGAGAMHVLCVSGLHVGIIFMVLHHVLAFLKRLPGGRYVTPAVIITLIWFYAALTGFSPSVMRAASMFSFVACGQCLGRSANIYNTLAASALVLLLADPMGITHIGFQLSYLAVLGIVSIQPWLFEKLKPPHWLGNRIWAILTVSVAAQLATGPLSLYYFNQFPNYFLLTNLVVIPLSAGIIYVALLAFAFSWLPFLSHLILGVLSYLLKALHVSVARIEALPYAVTSAVDVNVFETIMLAGLVLAAYFYWGRKWRRAFVFLLLCALMLVASSAVRHIMLLRNPQFVVYSIREGTAIDFFSANKEAVSLLCDRLREDSLVLRFNTSRYRIRRGVPEPEMMHLCTVSASALEGSWAKEGAYIRFLNKTLLLACDKEMNHLPSTWTQDPDMRFAVDFLIVGGHAGIRPEDMIRLYDPKMIIISADIPPWLSRQWLDMCEREEIPVWNVAEEGAFIQALPLEV